jgi:DNA-binding response OmpR family regulator
LSNGAEAIEYLGKTPPDAVLLDINLPGTSGFQILEDMRKDAAWKDTPVFILTNSDEKNNRARGEKLGVIDYLLKVNNGINDIVKKISDFYLHGKARRQYTATQQKHPPRRG